MKIQNCFEGLCWNGDAGKIARSPQDVSELLSSSHEALYVIEDEKGFGVAGSGKLVSGSANRIMAVLPAMSPADLGDDSFASEYGLKANYMSGAMANGIASEELVIAMGRAGFLGSFGAAGLIPSRVEQAILRIKQELPEGPAAYNLIHSPAEEALERGAVEMYLKYGVDIVEASAYLDLTEHIVRYRVAGLSLENGGVVRKNRVIAKVSRREVATRFLEPAPDRFLKILLAKNQITEAQAHMSRKVPMADDVIVEADSGGHTDNRPLVCMLPSMLELRDTISKKNSYTQNIRIGAGGGISTPLSALGAFEMGAGFIVTGSINQACLESGSCDHVRKVLASAEMADVAMAPAADMFEMGVRLQVLKRGTLFPMRASKLYELYREYPSLEAIPDVERIKIENQVFRRPLTDVWADTEKFFEERDPEMLSHAKADPKQRMALVFRWYLGLSSRWANNGEKGREMDYQIWCGPSMGAFNDWTKGTYLEAPKNRKAADAAHEILKGALWHKRVQSIRKSGVELNLPGLYRPRA